MTDKSPEAELLPATIGRLHLGERRADGERLCSWGHDIPAGHPMYWPQQISQYDDSDPCCIEHAIEQYVSEAGYGYSATGIEAGQRISQRDGGEGSAGDPLADYYDYNRAASEHANAEAAEKAQDIYFDAMMARRIIAQAATPFLRELPGDYDREDDGHDTVHMVVTKGQLDTLRAALAHPPTTEEPSGPREVERAWRAGFNDARRCVSDDEAFCLTEDVEEDTWLDSETRAAFSPERPAEAVDMAGVIEAMGKAYADATGYYTQFHRGLSSPSADKIRHGMRAAYAAASRHLSGERDRQIVAMREGEGEA